jgi:hypothetical protein
MFLTVSIIGTEVFWDIVSDFDKSNIVKCLGGKDSSRSWRNFDGIVLWNVLNISIATE